jgi:hypothetical protein
MEGAMQRYEIDKRRKQWVVSFDGNDLLYCKEKRLAHRIAKQANLLFQSESHEEDGPVPQIDAA